MTDLLLAIAHHLAVFTLVATLAAQFALLQPGLSGRQLAQLGTVDRAYGALAGAVIVIGTLRVILGASGWEYYVQNWAFWGKIGAFILVGLLSIPPTRHILGWRRQAATDAAFAPTDVEIRGLRRFLWAEAIVLATVPAFAAAMARGY